MKKLILAVGLLLALMARSVWAASTPIIAQQPKPYVGQILPAQTTTAVTMITAGATIGTVVNGISCSNTDSATGYAITFSLVRSAIIYSQTTVWIPLSAGNSAIISAQVPPVNPMAPAVWPGLPLDAKGNPYFYLAPNDTFTITSGATVNTGKAVSCVAEGSDFP